MIAAYNLLHENEINFDLNTMNAFSKLEIYRKHTSKDQQETNYQCPMNCEGNKTYSQPGKCPVCNMQLVMVGLDEPRIHVE